MPANSKPPIHRDPFSAANQPAPERRHRNGSRAKLGKRFFEDTYAAWEEQGESALARAAFHDPMGFVSMVARLMPQKLEISTPTDGMSDERLAQMLELAERMAALRHDAATPPGLIEHNRLSENDDYRTQAALLPAHAANHENGLHAALAGEGGGGPLRSTASGVVTSPHAIAAAAAKSADTPVAEHNELDVPDSGPATANSNSATKGVDTIDPLPYPVGRPFPKPDHEVERANRRALDDIDPASLF